MNIQLKCTMKITFSLKIIYTKTTDFDVLCREKIKKSVKYSVNFHHVIFTAFSQDLWIFIEILQKICCIFGENKIFITFSLNFLEIFSGFSSCNFYCIFTRFSLNFYLFCVFTHKIFSVNFFRCIFTENHQKKYFYCIFRASWFLWKTERRVHYNPSSSISSRGEKK